jgi:hypothetical protein
MIQFEVLSSPDANVVASFKFVKNEVYLGSKALDLSIDDPALLKNHLLIEIPENELIAHPQKGVEHYLINGKRATAIKKIKINDHIQIGQTILKVIAFSPTSFKSKKEILNEKLNKLIEVGSSRLEVIEILTKLTK